MLTKPKLIVAAAVLISATAFVTVHLVRGQDAGDEAKMMAEMMRLATPGPQHAELAKMAGKWESTFKVRWSPDAPWMETKGSSESSMILGGRYLMEKAKFEMMGKPMEGMQIIGFNNATGEYSSLWADTSSTAWTTSSGKADATGVIDYKGMMTDVAGTRPFRMTVKPSADAFHVEMFDTIPPAGEVLVMTIDSKRAAPAGGGGR